MACERTDDEARAQADNLICAACFAGVAYDVTMSASISVDKAPADLLRTFLTALIDKNSTQLDPYRVKNRPQTATHELMAQYGWSNVKQAELYTKGVDRVRPGIKSSYRVADQIENELSHTSNINVAKAAKKQNNSNT